jgi:hypothetical protein
MADEQVALVEGCFVDSEVAKNEALKLLRQPIKFPLFDEVPRMPLKIVSRLVACSTSKLILQFSQNTNSATEQTAIMADGIDRKADERMEFTTSKDVTVAPTFQDMHLKGTRLSETIPAMKLMKCRKSSPWNLCLRLRISLCRPVACHRPNLQRSRYHRPGAIWYR